MPKGLWCVVLAVVPCLGPSTPLAQSHNALPFGVGERLVYRVEVPRLRASGHGALWVEGPVDTRGVAAWVLHFDVSARVAFFKGTDHTRSWIDPTSLTTLRYVKRERHPLSHAYDTVEVFPDERRWVRGDGPERESDTDRPLDELSFIYFLRTLTLAPGETRVIPRHFDVERNPVRVTVRDREILTTAAGTFATIAIDMHVRDPRHYNGGGVIRLHLTDDALRIPVRIESRMPGFGPTILTLESQTSAREHLLPVVSGHSP